MFQDESRLLYLYYFSLNRSSSGQIPVQRFGEIDEGERRDGGFVWKRSVYDVFSRYENIKGS